VFDAGIDVMPKFDIEDVKTFPGILADGEAVEFTEKLHGTQIVLVRLPESMADSEQGRYRVSSKGLSAQGMAFQVCAENRDNVYVSAFMALGIAAKLDALAAALPGAHGQPLVVLAELVGSASQQDLKYGEQASVRPFEIALGTRSDLSYCDRDEVQRLAALVGWPSVPVLYRGPHSPAVLKAHTEGRETLSGKALHIREGVVIRTVPDRRDPAIGRVILKSINPSYSLRDGGSEHN
jgi:RNA ligase (TIGR02306 family)